MDLGSKILFVLVPILIVLGIGYVYHNAQLKEQVRLPLNEPKLIDENALRAPEQADRFWGSYRSNMYFGMKTRSPKSPVFGKH